MSDLLCIIIPLQLKSINKIEKKKKKLAVVSNYESK